MTVYTLFFITSASALLTAFLALWHKLRKMQRQLHKADDRSITHHHALFQQLEALHGLYAELAFEHSLPPTRGWAASPDFLLALARHARGARPQVVVECSSGVSTLVLARCLQRNGAGKVYSLEHDAAYASQTRTELHRLGLQDWAQVIDAPLRPYALNGDNYPWYDIDGLPHAIAIDLLVIDGPPQATRSMARYPAGPLLFPALAPGASVFLDDADRADEQLTLQRWHASFPALAVSSLPCEKGCTVLRSLLNDLPPAP